MAEGEWSDAGGILTLLDLIEQHRGAFEYDWRARFGLPLTCVPDEMGWAEAFRLTVVLAGDPSSQVAAAFAGWAHPVTRDFLVAADAYDLAARVAAGRRKPKPYPRPWGDKTKRTFGAGRGMSVADLRAVLDAQRTEGG